MADLVFELRNSEGTKVRKTKEEWSRFYSWNFFLRVRRYSVELKPVISYGVFFRTGGEETGVATQVLFQFLLKAERPSGREACLKEVWISTQAEQIEGAKRAERLRCQGQLDPHARQYIFHTK